MPELPEVETTRSGIEPHILGMTIDQVVVRQPKLRWPVPISLGEQLIGKQVLSVNRRAKYLLIAVDGGTMIMHLGMSGSLRVLSADSPPGKHDHVDICFQQKVLRLHDPRRFGAVLWTDDDPMEHQLIQQLGLEPLNEDFDGEYLHRLSRGRKSAVKTYLMNGHVVVGVGNIYANEALFQAGIHPKTAAGKISRIRYERLVEAVKSVLSEAIRQGGTTLRDFTREDGKPGYFAQQLNVYGRGGEQCRVCGDVIKEIRLGQRSTFYCSNCQH